MRIAIVYTTPFSEMAHTEGETLTLQTATLGDLVEVLGKRLGPKFKEALIDPSTQEVRSGMIILLHGRQSELSTKLKNGDEVAFLMAMAGG